MRYFADADTDVGIKKKNNQDSLTVKIANTPSGEALIAVICDGMGGLAKGELASAVVVQAFSDWFTYDFPRILSDGWIDRDIIRDSWTSIVEDCNSKLWRFGAENNIKLGTTITVLMFFKDVYYIMNVGDSRAYHITNSSIKQITKDHTLVAREVEMGNMTEEEAMASPSRSVLLQCIGASSEINPDFFIGTVIPGSVYLLCSDGFRHAVTPNEIATEFSPDVIIDRSSMKMKIRQLIELNKQRLETDNISAILIRTIQGV